MEFADRREQDEVLPTDESEFNRIHCMNGTAICVEEGRYRAGAWEAYVQVALKLSGFRLTLGLDGKILKPRMDISFINPGAAIPSLNNSMVSLLRMEAI
ncbi:hypothetical protein ACLK14_03420 [Escherichia coli]